MTTPYYVYDGQFRGNVLIIERRGCRKMYFIQRLTVNIFFLGKLVKVEWALI